MKRTAIFFLAIVALFTAIVLSLIITLTTARAGMYQAQANAAQAAANATQATTGLVSQCMTGLMVIVALVAGVAIGYGLGETRFSARQSLRPWRQGRRRKWKPGSNLWAQLPEVNPPRLPSPALPHTALGETSFSAIRPSAGHALTMADLDAPVEGEVDLIGSNWGF